MKKDGGLEAMFDWKTKRFLEDVGFFLRKNGFAICCGLCFCLPDLITLVSENNNNNNNNNVPPSHPFQKAGQKEISYPRNQGRQFVNQVSVRDIVLLVASTKCPNLGVFTKKYPLAAAGKKEETSNTNVPMFFGGSSRFLFFGL